MTISTLARHLGVHRYEAELLVRRGELGCARRVGSRWQIDPDAVQTLMKRRAIRGRGRALECSAREN